MPATASQPRSVVIIGAGVIGLSCAIKLQAALSQIDSAHDVEIVVVAREWPTSIPGSPIHHSPDYASMWAGAHVRPIPATTPQLRREAQWLKQTVSEFASLVDKEPWAGLFQTGGVEYLEEPPQGYKDQTKESFESETGLGGYKILGPSEMPEGIKLGFEYSTFCVNSPIYCANLLRKFILRGGKTLQRDLRNEWESFSLRPNVVLAINASGTGFGDCKSFPTRGQTVIVNLPRDITKTVTRQNKDGSWSFVIPRAFNGGVILGGTKEPGIWKITPEPATRQRLLERGTALIPYATNDATSSAPNPSVVSDVVGRRPTRDGGMRIETVEEQLTGTRGELRTGHVLHAYGAGGRGYEISWGVAQEVSEMAQAILVGRNWSRPKL